MHYYISFKTQHGAASALEPLPFLWEHTQASLLGGCKRYVEQSGLPTGGQHTPDVHVSLAAIGRST